jgi:hypothetical protein
MSTLKQLRDLRAQNKISRIEYNTRKTAFLGGAVKQQSVKSVVRKQQKNKNNNKSIVVSAVPRPISQNQRPMIDVKSAKGLYTGEPSRGSSKTPTKDYIKSLVNPSQNMSRIPDAFDRPTGIFRSISSFDVPLTIDSFTNGKFSFCLQPILGDRSQPSSYQCAVANGAAISANSTKWSQVNWANSANYMGFDGIGTDPRVDVNGALMTANTPSYYENVFNVATSTDLSSANLISNSGLGTLSPTTSATYNLNSTGFVNPQFSSAANNNGSILLPFGDYSIVVAAKFLSSVLPVGGIYCIGTDQASSAPGYVNIVNVNQPATLYTAINVNVEAVATFEVVSSPGHQIFTPVLTSVQSGVTPEAPAANITVNTTTLDVVPTNFLTTSNYSDGGIIEEIRPVSQAVLVTYMGTTLNNGGEIAISYCPAKLLTNNFFSCTTNGLGQLQEFSNLRRVDCAYDGPLRDGAYCFWAPYDVSDTKLMSPNAMNNYDYPGIICSGQFTPDATVNAPTAAIRVMVYTNYEFVTKYTMFELETNPGSTSAFEAALIPLKNKSFASANKTHLQRIREILKTAGQFYRDNSSWINPGAMALMGLL